MHFLRPPTEKRTSFWALHTSALQHCCYSSKLMLARQLGPLLEAATFLLLGQIARTIAHMTKLYIMPSTAAKTLPIPTAIIRYITIQFLPTNTTSRIRSLDAGIIAAFKKHYRARQYAEALLEAELGSKDIYKMDILMAMRLCQQIWREFSSSIVRNCWRHTGLVDDNGEEEDDGEDAVDA